MIAICVEGVAYVYFAKSICGAEQTLSVLINLFLLAVADKTPLSFLTVQICKNLGNF